MRILLLAMSRNEPVELSLTRAVIPIHIGGRQSPCKASNLRLACALGTYGAAQWRSVLKYCAGVPLQHPQLHLELFMRKVCEWCSDSKHATWSDNESTCHTTAAVRTCHQIICSLSHPFLPLLIPRVHVTPLLQQTVPSLLRRTQNHRRRPHAAQSACRKCACMPRFEHIHGATVFV